MLSSLQLSGNHGDSDPHPEYDRKTNFWGGKFGESALDRSTPNVGCENDFELLEGDVNTTHIYGRNIGYNALYNRIMFLWKPANSILLMDIDNGYFLVKFQDFVDYNRALMQGPWV
ncbi:hypothetical protein Goklo_011128, partial [Gossypium klotzschianum]|nr:hypothetical protein [Gossypium klotzschianum]